MTTIRRNAVVIEEARQVKLDAVRKTYVVAMNAAIGKVRERFVTNLPGQDMIYKAKEDEARRYLQEQPETLEEYPFIQAELGILAPTPELVAQTWIGMGNLWREIAAMLEGLRMTTSNALQVAQSAEEMEQIMEQFQETLNASL